jgi:hypothetical protein
VLPDDCGFAAFFVFVPFLVIIVVPMSWRRRVNECR